MYGERDSAGVLAEDRREGWEALARHDGKATAYRTGKEDRRGSRSEAAGPNARAKFHCVMAVGLTLLFAGDAVAMHCLRLTGFGKIMNALPEILLLLIIGGYCHWRGLDKFSEILFLAVWTISLLVGLQPLVLAAGRSPMPLVDLRLAQIDHSLGFSTAVVVQLIAAIPWLQRSFGFCYDAMPAPVICVLFVPVFCGQAKHSRRFLLAAVFATVLTAALFTVFPATGPWQAGGFTPTEMQAAIRPALMLLKSARSVELGALSTGIVTFPSFHVVMAILPVFALWRIRSIRWFALAFAIAICISTLTTGWHYLTDVFGGAAVAFTAQALSSWIMKRMEDTSAASERNWQQQGAQAAERAPERAEIHRNTRPDSLDDLML